MALNLWIVFVLKIFLGGVWRMHACSIFIRVWVERSCNLAICLTLLSNRKTEKLKRYTTNFYFLDKVLEKTGWFPYTHFVSFDVPLWVLKCVCAEKDCYACQKGGACTPKNHHILLWPPGVLGFGENG